MAESKGTQQIMELVAALELVAMAGKAAMKDGKIDFADTAVVMDLLQKQSVLIKGFTGFGEIVEEGKDLSLDEAVQLITALVIAAKKVAAA